MIDINELRQSLGAIQPEELNEILNRLEAAEKERDALLAETKSLREGLKRMCLDEDANAKEAKTLRAKIAEMEKQKPIAHVWRCDNGHIHGSCESELLLGQPLYALPGVRGESE